MTNRPVLALLTAGCLVACTTAAGGSRSGGGTSSDAGGSSDATADATDVVQADALPGSDASDTAVAEDADSPSDAPAPADVAGGEDVSDSGGVNTEIGPPDPPVGQDQICDGASEPAGGGYPFTGLTVTPGTPESEGTSWAFSCTMCPGGTLGIDGKYVYFENDDVRSQGPGDYQETIEFSGNSFVNVIKGVDADGALKTVTATGYFFCPDPSELAPMKSPEFWNIVIVYLSADPAGAFGLDGDDIDLAFLGVETIGGPDRIGLAVNQFWDLNGTWQNTFEYCLVGSVLDGKVCTAPF